MQRIYIRIYDEGCFDVYNSKHEFETMVYNEFKQEEEEGFPVPDDIYDVLSGVLKFDSSKCETINDAISELFSSNEHEDLLYDIDEYNEISKEDLLNNSSISYNIKGVTGYWVNLIFDIIEVDKDDIFNSKIKNAKIEVL